MRQAHPKTGAITGNQSFAKRIDDQGAYLYRRPWSSCSFGLTRRFLHDSGEYGELETGETTLPFASLKLGSMNLPDGFIAASESSKPIDMKIALVTPSVTEAHEKALAAGAIALKEPEIKPWGQIVSYIRCRDGTLVEICSPVGSQVVTPQSCSVQTTTNSIFCRHLNFSVNHHGSAPF